MDVQIRDYITKTIENTSITQRYRKGVYQIGEDSTQTFLKSPDDEELFLSGVEVWIHEDEVSIQLPQPDTQKSDKHYRMLDKISNYGELPYFKSMEALGIYDKDDQEYIMRNILGNDISIKGRSIYYYGDMIYYEESDGDWVKNEYDDKGNRIYFVDSDGYWGKYEYTGYQHKGFFHSVIVTQGLSGGYWEKSEYDEDGEQISFEVSDGF
jgi:hypothetical protein